MRTAIVTAALCVLVAASSFANAQEAVRRNTVIPAQELATALQSLVKARKFQIVYSSELLANRRSRGASGELTMDEALRQLLSGTGLTFRYLDDATVTIVPASESAATNADSAGSGMPDAAGRVHTSAFRLARAAAQITEQAEEVAKSADSRTRVADERSDKGIPEILVKGARTSNTDIRRTEDDVQPYVVFDAEEISRSMVPDLETFLKTRLPMNQVRTVQAQDQDSLRGNQSTINLRGLGAEETLVLVDGRRMPAVGGAQGEYYYQPDINGIPLSAVERIEILPSTAGGIYGGGATGGVVNIILKRNYSDLEVSARYDGTFAGGGAERRVDMTAGFTLEGGRTSVMLVASHRDANPLYVGDRDFAVRSRRLQEHNDPDGFLLANRPLRGYTTNIKSVSGRDLVLLEGMRSLDSPIAHVPVGYSGTENDRGAIFSSTAGRYNLDLADDIAGRGFSLTSAPTVRSAVLSLRRDFGRRVEAFLDASRYDTRSLRSGGYTAANSTIFRLPAGQNNPFTEPVYLNVPVPGYDADRLQTRSRSVTEQLSGGLIVRLPRQWMVQGEYAWGRSTFSYGEPRTFLSPDGMAAFIDGRLDPFRDVNDYPLDLSTYYPDDPGEPVMSTARTPTVHEDATLRVAGPLLRAPGGPLRLAALMERREQSSDDSVLAFYSPGLVEPTYYYFAARLESTVSAYSELTVPLVSAVNAHAGLRGLDLQASYRYDRTRTHTLPSDSRLVVVPSREGPFPEISSETTTVSGNQYTFGFRYLPAGNLALRMSYGVGILPPSAWQASPSDLQPFILNYFGLTDPKRDGELITDATVQDLTTFGSVLLRPEHSRSWSAGIVLTPDMLPGFRLSVDYTRIEKTDEITLLDNQTIVDLEDEFPGRVLRHPLTPEDEVAGFTVGVIRALSFGNVNLANSLTEAFDVQADYGWSTRFGDFAANVIATVQPRYRQQATLDSETLDTVGYSDGPLKWRINAGVQWARGPLSLGWNMQYYDASRIYSTTSFESTRTRAVNGQGSAWIPTQSYHDVFGRYRFGDSTGFAGGLLENTELLISVQNVFNDSPPILANGISSIFNGYSTDGDPRLRRYSISFTKRFGLKSGR